MSARVSALVRALLAVMVVGSEAGAGEVRLCRRATLLSCTAAALPWTRQGLAAPPLTPPSLRQVVERTLSASDQERLPVRLVQQLFQGLDAPDIFYPDWFGRKWRATSTLLQVLAPAGPELFTPGRNGSLALANARAGIGEALQYDVRWIKTSGQWIVDREFNLASITRASMGGRAVQDIQADSPDRCHLYIRPSAAPGSAVYRAELRVIARKTDPVSTPAQIFDCAETVRQTVVLVPGEKSDARIARPPMVKEVETICTYELDPVDGVMRGYQRTATFLAADASYTSDASFAEQQAVQLARGPGGRQVAIDVRTYQLLYEPA